MGLFVCLNSRGIWMVWRNAGEICERKTLFRMKKEANQAGFKGGRTEPSDVVSMTGTYYSIYILHLNYIYNGDNCFG